MALVQCAIKILKPWTQTIKLHVTSRHEPFSFAPSRLVYQIDIRTSVKQTVMSVEMLVVETTQSSFKILKWIGGGGFGQVFKVMRNNKVCPMAPCFGPYGLLTGYRLLPANRCALMIRNLLLLSIRT
jgi:hypothetical protein